MTVRTAQPGLVTGGIGFVAGLLGLVFDVPLFGAIAGILALAAGIAGVILARRLTKNHQVAELDEDPFAELDELEAAAVADDEVKGESRSEGNGEPSSPTPVAAAKAALIDPATGLFTETFFLVTLQARVAAARRHLRPVSVVMLEVVDGLPASDPSPVDIDLVANVVRETLREADTSCRLDNGYVALLLEDTPENGAIWTVERIRRRLAEARAGSTVWAGVACYPAHAFSTEEILGASERALVSAREWRQDRIEVAVAAD